MEIQFAYCLYVQNNLEFLIQFRDFDQSFNKKDLIHYAKKFGTYVCVCATSSYSLLHTILEFADMLRSSNLHWGYSFIIKVGQWFYELGHVLFLKRFPGLKTAHCPFNKFIALTL